MHKWILILALTAINCAPTKQLPEPLQRQWMLVQFQNYEQDFLVRNRASLDLSPVKAPPQQFSAHMGCNRIFLKAETKSGGVVKFSDIGSTLMYCDNNMQLEDNFGKTLPKMTRYEIDGHDLTLSDKDGNKMKFVAADWD